MGEDPFGTHALRSRVLDAWASSPARFREDANAEDDLVRGGYRDRVVVELAQNAADAAARAGVPGRLVLRLTGDLLVAANTGAPLDAPGVESLSTLRASTKRDDAATTAGRFGVGFAAVLAVTDEPRIASRTGGVRWDATAVRHEVESVGSLRAELERRHGQLPVLRLPYAWSAPPPADATTVVELPLRDAGARDLVVRLLADVDDALLIALPALEEIVVEVDGVRRVVSDAGHWQVVHRSGRLEPGLLADRPVEERDRPVWSVAWARPLRGQPVPGTVHAPTPTDEPLDLPALLVASFPLDPTRRHVAPGPLTELLVNEAAAAYVDLVGGVEDPAQRWGLVPAAVPVGRLDGRLRAAIVTALAGAPVLRTVSGGPVAPRDAVSVVGLGDRALSAVSEVLPGLVTDHPALERLGGRRLGVADAVDLLADLDRTPAWWRDLYAALAEGPVDPDALGALPVPLADGRLVRGPRGAMLPGDDLPEELSPLGLRLVHGDAAHPLLTRLGASTATARTVLARGEVRSAVESSWDNPDPAALAEVVLSLVAAAALRPGELPWLGALRLLDEEGDPASADELLLPGSVLAALGAPGELGVVHPDLVQRWGPDPLAALGVLADLTVAEVQDLLLDPAAVDDDAPLPALADWVEWALGLLGPVDLPPTVRAVRGIRELDVVSANSWPDALSRLADDLELRSALLDPVPVDLGATGRAEVPSYAAWWLRTRALLGGHPPGQWRVPGATGLAGLYDELAELPGVDRAVLAAAGVRTSLEDVLAEPGGADELLDRLADPDRTVPDETLRAVYLALARVDPDTVHPPETVRVSAEGVVPAVDVVVVDAPHHLQLTWPQPPLVVPLSAATALAEVLDVAPSSQRAPHAVRGGELRDVPAAVLQVLDGAPATWREHDDLVVAGHEVGWWVDPDGTVHAATLDGLARGLAWAAGRWADRLLVAAVLEAPDRAGELLAERALEG